MIGNLAMETRPNFYALLDLSPSINDWATIESTIKNKRREWSLHKNQGTPTQRRKAERNLRYIPEMEVLFKDIKCCEKEAKAFQIEQKKEKQTQLKQLDTLIQNIHSPVVSSELIKKLMHETSKVFTIEEIENRLKQNGIVLEKDIDKSKKIHRPRLEESVAKGIRDELNTFKLKSLYDFLNLSHTPKLSLRSSPRSLYERADTIYKELSRVGKTDADSTLAMGLAGRAKSVFTDDKEKQRYDNTLALEVLIGLDTHLEVTGYNKFLTTKNIETLLEIGKKLGVTDDAVIMEYIEEFAANRKWGVQREIESVKIKRQICGACGALATSSQDKRCLSCGDELTQPCPKCGNPTPTENAVCSQCGCHTGDAPLVKSLLKEGQRLISEGDYDQAIVYLTRALGYWENWPPLIQNKQQAQTKKKESYEALEVIKALIRSRKLELADSKLSEYQQKFSSSNTASIRSQINEGLTQAKIAFVSAEKYRSDGKSEVAFDKYEESLLHCLDYSPTLSAMAANPPPAPNNITVKWMGDTLRLSWSEVKARGQLSYSVVRKTNGIPSSLKDGDIIATTTIPQIDDISVKPGVIYYYGIFSIRAGCASAAFASSGPHLLTAEVSHVECQSGDKQVTIRWTVPFGSTQVEVWRREGLAPLRRGEGQKITVSGNSLVDMGLENGRCYGYLIIVKYRHPEEYSRSLYSNGFAVSAVPVILPEPVNDLKIRRNGHSVFLSWTPVQSNAQVQIRQIQSIPEMISGKIISLKDADQYGMPIPITSIGKAQTTLKSQGRVFFIPLSVVSETAILGKPVSVTTLDEVSNLESKRNGNNIILIWQWPTGATEALITYHYDHYPTSADENEVAKERITLSEYLRNNYWELCNVARKKHYFTVFTRDSSANIYSSGVNVLEALGQEMTVRYQVVTKRKFFSRAINSATIEFQSEFGEVVNEKLLVVLQQNFPPASKDQGVVIAMSDKLIFKNGLASIEISEEYFNRQGYIKVFFNRSEAAKEVRLLPLQHDKLKLN